MKQAFFNEDFLVFFMDLAPNNNKDWFDINRQRYLKSIKAPFEAFVTHLISKMNKDYPLGDLKASDCIFRINKDVRFSKDKTPYKLQTSALIKKGGKKAMHEAGLYIEFGPEFLQIYTGVYMPEKDQLERIRQSIAKSPDQFKKIIDQADFKKYFGTPKGERSKILPAPLKAAAANCEWIYNKQFYLQHTVDAEKILEPGIDDYILKVFKVAKKYNEFLEP
jgi:uncharacterized protein (TIGR02453 family)